jgi:hypothetical protein
MTCTNDLSDDINFYTNDLSDANNTYDYTKLFIIFPHIKSQISIFRTIHMKRIAETAHSF